MAEGVLERVVQHGRAHVQEGLHGRPAPAHLLLLGHALGHDLVDRALHERGRERLTTPPPSSVMPQRGLVALEIAQQLADVSRHVSELLCYLERNQAALGHYAARRRRGEPLSTAFVESAVNEIVAKRMTKKQQMRWSRATVQPFLDVRTAVLNDTLEDAFRHRYPGFRPANDDQMLPAAA